MFPNSSQVHQSRGGVDFRIAKDKRFERLACMHIEGTSADDCIVARVMQHRCYIVATNDQALRRKVRKIPGVFVGRGNYKVESLPTELVV
jgi:U3 small nucleolar RNA-associated protein 24